MSKFIYFNETEYAQQSNSGMSQDNKTIDYRTDSMLEIAHQLKRIADLLHTEVNEIKLDTKGQNET